MAEINNEEVVASSTGTFSKKVWVENEASFYLINSANISSDTVTFDLLEPDKSTGGQAQFNGTSYQLDSSNTVIYVKGPIALSINKTGAANIGLGAYAKGGLRYE